MVLLLWMGGEFMRFSECVEVLCQRPPFWARDFALQHG